MNEHAVTVLYLVAQVFQCHANIGTSGLLVLQVSNVAGGYLHGRGHLRGRCAVNSRTGQWRRAGIQIAADANDERMAINPRGQTTNTQCEH